MYYLYIIRPVVFSFDSPQEYIADFVMATLATTTGDITTDHQRTTTRPSAPTTSTTSRPNSSNNKPAVSVSKQKSFIDHSDIIPTPPPAVSIAETPNKDGNPASWLQERIVASNGTDHNNGEHVIIGSRPVEDDKKEFVANSHDRETDNLLDSLFDDIINDDIADNVYGFTHQHTSTGGILLFRDGH